MSADPYDAVQDARSDRGEWNDGDVADDAAAAAREEVGTMEEQLVEALRAIVAVPSERTLLLNAEARAMYEIAKRALREADRVLP